MRYSSASSVPAGSSGAPVSSTGALQLSVYLQIRRNRNHGPRPDQGWRELFGRGGSTSPPVCTQSPLARATGQLRREGRAASMRLRPFQQRMYGLCCDTSASGVITAMSPGGGGRPGCRHAPQLDHGTASSPVPYGTSPSPVVSAVREHTLSRHPGTRAPLFRHLWSHRDGKGALPCGNCQLRPGHCHRQTLCRRRFTPAAAPSSTMTARGRTRARYERRGVS